MQKTVSLEDAKVHLAECIKAAEEGETVVITREGQPVVALVSALKVSKPGPERVAGPEQGLISLLGGWEGSDELASLIEESSRTASSRG